LEAGVSTARSTAISDPTVEEEQRVHERAVSGRCAMLLQFWLDGEERLRMLREIRDERLDAKEAVRESKKLAEWRANLAQPGNSGLQSSESIDVQVRAQLPPAASVRGNVVHRLDSFDIPGDDSADESVCLNNAVGEDCRIGNADSDENCFPLSISIQTLILHELEELSSPVKVRRSRRKLSRDPLHLYKTICGMPDDHFFCEMRLTRLSFKLLVELLRPWYENRCSTNAGTKADAP
jgi:hypothetical protein